MGTSFSLGTMKADNANHVDQRGAARAFTKCHFVDDVDDEV